ncbi:MAG: hypothetical protein J6L70_00500 [Alphaproteobacteria bacterium]|nr:hypothetical protein [Alphaproteobacteria bacterium]
MNFVKKYFKILIGGGVLIMALFVFTMSLRSHDLSGGTLKNWLSANNDERVSTVRALVGGDENTDIIVACVSKMATLPDSGEMTISDAARLCNLGMQLKESL